MKLIQSYYLKNFNSRNLLDSNLTDFHKNYKLGSQIILFNIKKVIVNHEYINLGRLGNKIYAPV